MTESAINERFIHLIERVSQLETQLEAALNELGRLDDRVENLDYEIQDVTRDVHWIEDTISDLEDEVRNHDHG